MRIVGIGLILVMTACTTVVTSYPGGPVVEYRAGERPATDFSPRERVDGGYKINFGGIDNGSVVFPRTGWKHVGWSYVGENCVVDPRTETSFCFASVRFGKKFIADFLFFSWYGYEHRWAEKWLGSEFSEDNQKAFLQEWLERSLLKKEIVPSDRLGITLPLLSSEPLKSRLYLLQLADKNLSFLAQAQKVGTHNFSQISVPTYVDYGDKLRQFETDIWLSYFRYVPKLRSGDFLLLSHIFQVI